MALGLLALLLGSGAFLVLGAPWRTDGDLNDLDTSGAAPVLFAEDGTMLAAPAASHGRSSGNAAAQVDARGLLTNEAWIDVVVRSAPDQLPVEGAELYLVGSRIDRATTDGDGYARVKVRAGEILVGAQPPEGASLVAMEIFDDSFGPLAEKEVTVPRGGDVSVELHLQSASVLFGRVVATTGEPVFEEAAFELAPHGPRWIESRRVTTDGNGAFDSGPLFAGRYTVRPIPGGIVLFQPFEVDLVLGERRPTDIHALVEREIVVQVELVQETSGDPWPLPAIVELIRTDRLSQYRQMKNYQRRSLGSGDEKGPCRFHVRDGSYTLEVSSMGWSGTTNWISAPWSRSQTAEIEPKTEEQRVTLTVPDVGPVARFDGRLGGNVAPSAWSIQARYVDVDGEEQVISLDLDEETRTFTLLVDTAHVQSPTVDFVEDLGADRQPLLHAAELRPGEHSIVLVPTGG